MPWGAAKIVPLGEKCRLTILKPGNLSDLKSAEGLLRLEWDEPLKATSNHL